MIIHLVEEVEDILGGVVKKQTYKDIENKAYTKNLDKWGKDENHNTLYITGYSGSGKTTFAKDTDSELLILDSIYNDEIE